MKIKTIQPKLFSVNVKGEVVEGLADERRCMLNLFVDEYAMVKFTDQNTTVGTMTQVLSRICVPNNYMPLWSGSGGKNREFVLMDKDVYSKLFTRFPAQEIAVYGGLLLSDVQPAAEQLEQFEYTDCDDGEDGNSLHAWAGQFRSISVDTLTTDEEGYACAEGLRAIGKGTFYQAEETTLNTSQIKLQSEGWQEGTTIVAPTYVTGACGVQNDSWLPWAITKPTGRNIEFVVDRTKKAVSGLLDLLTEDNVIGLLQRLGALNVEVPKRGAVDALRADLPYCKQLMDRLGRLIVRELASVIASCGCKAYSYQLVMSNAFGEPGTDRGKYALWGMPHHSRKQLGFSERDPRGVITETLAKKLTRDADGDALLVSKGPEVNIWHRDMLDIEFSKDKTRERAPMKRTMGAMIRTAALVAASGSWVGRCDGARIRVLEAMWRAERDAERADDTAKAYYQGLSRDLYAILETLSTLAVEAPQAFKLKLESDFEQRMYAAIRECRSMKPAIWKEQLNRMDETWNIWTLHLEPDPDPVTLNAHAYNAACKMINEWIANNTLEASTGIEWVGEPSGGAPAARARSLRVMWGSFFASHLENDTLTPEAQDSFFAAYKAQCERLSLEEVIAVAARKPTDTSDLIAWKFHTISFSRYSFTDVYGWREGVYEEIVAREERRCNRSHH